ncbi:MAG: tRNA pseudouridine(38-40) synthase TruA [Deferrisomatales bacterium]
MRNLRLTLEYDGTAYAGWQVQAGAPTVQAEVERALGVMLKAPVRVTGSGRTDAGVHALGQVANFRTEARVPLKGVLHGLNALLPADLSVRRVDEMPLGFDSRRSAKDKTYQYFLHVGAAPSAFARRTSWRVPGPLDLGAMEAAAALLVGAHDFGAFRAAGCDAAHSVRLVHEAWVRPRGEYLELGVRGTAFLRHMVRIVAGTLVEVGQGRRSVEAVARALATGHRSDAGVTAPPQGLFLAEVRYGVEPLESYP